MWKHTGISIHAPARGATNLPILPGFPCRISIHAPARGATSQLLKHFFRKPDFNPRSREGSDFCYGRLVCVIYISIHAPARGATGLDRLANDIHGNFNPRSREGSDGKSTLLNIMGGLDFNPRSREGSDSIYEWYMP